jgi:hypothetical protein
MKRPILTKTHDHDDDDQPSLSYAYHLAMTMLRAPHHMRLTTGSDKLISERINIRKGE